MKTFAEATQEIVQKQIKECSERLSELVGGPGYDEGDIIEDLEKDVEKLKKLAQELLDEKREYRERRGLEPSELEKRAKRILNEV